MNIGAQKGPLSLKEIDTAARRIQYVNELECVIAFEAIERYGISDFRVTGGVCDEGDPGRELEITELITRTEAPTSGTQFVREFAAWLELRKRVPF